MVKPTMVKGQEITCPHCLHTWIRIVKERTRQDYCACSMCHRNIMLHQQQQTERSIDKKKC
jgi:hypothetical protein